jgi:hypothetical protein
VQNLPLFTEGTETIFQPTFTNYILEKTEPIIASLNNLNRLDKTTTPTQNDIYCLLSNALASDPEYDQLLSDAMTSSPAIFVSCSQMRVMRAVLTNSESYAEKLVDDRPSSLAFKAAKSIPTSQAINYHLLLFQIK